MFTKNKLLFQFKLYGIKQIYLSKIHKYLKYNNNNNVINKILKIFIKKK